MNYAEIVLGFAGGIGLFLYGMHIMASGLQKAAGSRMKKILEAIISNKMMGVLLGTLVTAIIQSSTATTVMVVGFVNAGVMTITQSVGVIMGANIGTTTTSWLVASVEWTKYFNPVTIAPIAIITGAFMLLFTNKHSLKQIGEILVGFGILFLGLQSMTTSAEPLSQSEFFRDMFYVLGSNPLLGLLAGTLVTAVIQSSTASVGILQSLALTGLVPWNAAVYIIMGQNIGTCGTAIISAIGANRNAKSASYIHLIFNVAGSVIFTLLAMLFFYFVNPALGSSPVNMTEISLINTVQNIASTAMLYPLSGLLVKTANKMAGVNAFEKPSALLTHLDYRILETPAFAIENCLKEVANMFDMAIANLATATKAFVDKDEESVETVLLNEKDIDSMDHALTDFLVKLCNQNLSDTENVRITSLFHIISDIERVGDHSENIAELADYIIKEEISLSDTALEELSEMIDLTKDCIKQARNAFVDERKDSAALSLEEEEKIDDLVVRLRQSHIDRLKAQQCDSVAGVVYLDMLTNLERISDHAKNIAEMS